MEREEPSEQPCREGEGPPVPPSPISMVTTLIRTTFHMMIEIIQPGFYVMEFRSLFKMVLDVVETFAEAIMDVFVATEMSMSLESTSCLTTPFPSEDDLIVPDFNSWKHEDASYYYIASHIHDPLVTSEGSGSLTVNNLTLTMIVIPKQMVVRTVGILVTGGDGTGGGRGRIAIYDTVSGGDMYPNNLIVDCAISNGNDMDVSTTGFKTLTVGTTLSPGAYWIGTIFSTGCNLGLAKMVTAGLTNLILGGKKTTAAFDTTSSIRVPMTYPASSSTPLASTYPTVGMVEIGGNFLVIKTPAIFVSYGS